MRFVVAVEAVGPHPGRDDEPAFRVQIRDDGGAEIAAERHLPGRKRGSYIYPRPPDGEPIPEDAPHRALCVEDSAEAIDRAMRAVAGRAPAPEQIIAFARYLLVTLLGDAGWDSIRARAGASPIELVLSWSPELILFTRLPWELMRGTGRSGLETFLAAERVAFTRILRPRRKQVCHFRSPLRVLFVVAGPLGDPEIRAGAEYLCLLRRLRRQHLCLIDRLLVDPSGERMQREIDEFRPDVVHFIGHGEVRSGRAFLRLASEEPGEPSRPVGAEVLETHLRGDGELPGAVIFNACHTGAALQNRFATPLAAELVGRGVPVAVGMGGRIGDRACRLFARRFYEALASGESIALATAEGRRAAFQDGSPDPLRSVDWARPALFMRDGVTVTTAATDTDDESPHQIAARFRLGADRSPGFCDRLDFIRAYRGLTAAKRAARHTILCVEVDTRPAERGDRFGRSRLIRELAFQSVLDHMAPCIVSAESVAERRDSAPDHPALQLGLALVMAIRETRHKFGRKRGKEYEVYRLLDVCLGKKDPEALSESVADEEGGGIEWHDPPVVAAAVRVDLRKLAETLGRRPIVFFDDLDRAGDLGRMFLDRFLDSYGLGDSRLSIPVVCTCATVGDGSEFATLTARLGQSLDASGSHVRRMPLRAFAHEERAFAYRQFLLAHDPPLIVRADDDGGETDIHEELQTEVAGVPSRLGERSTATLIRCALRARWVEEADDDRLLEAMRRERVGGGS